MSSRFSRQIPKISRPEPQTTTNETLIFLRRQCVAFVGAGFSKPITKVDWKGLLFNLLAHFCTDPYTHPELAKRCEDLKEKLGRGQAEDFTFVAQVIEDIVGEDKFQEFIRQKCKLDEVWS